MAIFNPNTGRIELDPLVFKKTIEEKKKDKYGNSYYDNTTFAILLLDIISHEYFHYIQFAINNRYINEQNYLNQLSVFLNNYFEKSLEGEAYGFGVNMINYYIDNNYIPDKDIELFNKQMNNNSLIKDKISQQHLINYTCMLPFTSDNNMFESIIESINKYLEIIPENRFIFLTQFFPLIILGISKEEKEKDAYELIKQYIDKKIYYNNYIIDNISEEELNNIIDIIYSY